MTDSRTTDPVDMLAAIVDEVHAGGASYSGISLSARLDDIVQRLRSPGGARGKFKGCVTCGSTDYPHDCTAPEPSAELVKAQLERGRIREYLRIYGGHIPPCPGRPCECGFADAWKLSGLPESQPRSAPGARDEDDAPELTADDFKRPSAKWNAPEPREEQLNKAARKIVAGAVSLRDHLSSCDKTMGDTHACTCGMWAYRRLLESMDSPETKEAKP